MGKEVLTTGKFTYGTVPVEYGVTALDMTKSVAEVDLTDTATTGNEKEYEVGRVEKTFTATMWKNVSIADPPVGESHPAILDFEGYTYSGTAWLTEVAPSASIDEGVALAVTGRFTGTVVETPKP